MPWGIVPQSGNTLKTVSSAESGEDSKAEPPATAVRGRQSLRWWGGVGAPGVQGELLGQLNSGRLEAIAGCPPSRRFHRGFISASGALAPLARVGRLLSAEAGFSDLRALPAPCARTRPQERAWGALVQWMTTRAFNTLSCSPLCLENRFKFYRRVTFPFGAPDVVSVLHWEGQGPRASPPPGPRPAHPWAGGWAGSRPLTRGPADALDE